MYDDYVEYFKKYSAIYGDQTAIFLQVGKFYEFYDILDPTTGEGQTTTKKIVDHLGIKLTYKKASGPGNRDGLWAGVPTQSLHNFAMRLTKENWTCVIIDETKDRKGKITRDVSRILSPGTHIETAESSYLESMYLATLYLEEGQWGSFSPPTFAASVVDLTTGETASYQGKATGRPETWASDDLLHFFQVHPPKECVVYWKGDTLTIPNEGFLRSRCGLTSSHIHLKSAETLGNIYERFTRREILKRIFKPKSILPIEVYLQIEKENIEISLTSLLRFVEDHFPSFSEHFQTHSIWLPTERVFLGNNVLTQLNILCQREEDSVLGMFMKTHTLMGRRAMRQRLLYPISNIDTLKGKYKEIQTISELSEKDKQILHQYLQNISDIARLHRKIQVFSITANDVLLLEQSYIRILQAAHVLTGTYLEIPEEKHKQIKNYIEDFKLHFDIEKCKQVNEDLMFLPNEKAPKTASSEAALQKLKESVNEIVTNIAKWAGLAPESLRIESRDTLLYCITCSKGSARTIQEKIKTVEKAKHPYPGISTTEKKSGGNINVPLLESIHTQVFERRSELQKHFQEELPPICENLTNKYSDIWSTLEKWVSNLDVTITLEKVASERGLVMPQLIEPTESSFVEIEGLRHPLIEAQQTRVEYIKHDVSLGKSDSKGWLIYGMNASGKSSLMKSIGISVLLAQCGSFVPATSMKLAPYTSIFTRILNHDNLWAGLSSFAVEMTELREILLRADNYSLVLGDEVCNGTESVSGTSLVASSLVWLTERNSSFVFATHLHGLLALSEIQNLNGLQIWHLRVKYDPVSGVLHYERTLHRGSGSTYYGLEVARALNLPHEFLEKAQSFRHLLLGSVREENSSASSWNPIMKRKSCEVCKAEIVADIEIHHIRERSEADKSGIFSDGTNMNHIRNLISVCKSCHDKHHANEIVIGQVKQTSEGEMREIVSVVKQSTQNNSKSKWTDEEQKIIVEMVKKYVNLSPQRVKLDLEQKHGIEISTSTLQKIRKQGHF